MQVKQNVPGRPPEDWSSASPSPRPPRLSAAPAGAIAAAGAGCCSYCGCWPLPRPRASPVPPPKGTGSRRRRRRPLPPWVCVSTWGSTRLACWPVPATRGRSNDTTRKSVGGPVKALCSESRKPSAACVDVKGRKGGISGGQIGSSSSSSTTSTTISSSSTTTISSMLPSDGARRQLLEDGAIGHRRRGSVVVWRGRSPPHTPESAHSTWRCHRKSIESRRYGQNHAASRLEAQGSASGGHATTGDLHQHHAHEHDGRRRAATAMCHVPVPFRHPLCCASPARNGTCGACLDPMVVFWSFLGVVGRYGAFPGVRIAAFSSFLAKLLK